jgi:hypothetical protein
MLRAIPALVGAIFALGPCASSWADSPVHRLPRTESVEVATYPPQDYRPPVMFNPPPSQLPPWEQAGGEELGSLPGTFRGDLLGEPVPQRISDIKPGAFQKLSFTGAWMPGGDELGISDLETFAVFGLPCPTIEAPLLITPYFAVHYLDGPTTPDLPARLFDATVQFRWLPKLPFAPWFRADLAIEPGVHSDFEAGDADAFRLPGHGLAIMDWTPTRKVVFGVLYLDREDVEILPAGGLILSPNENVQLDLVFPKPKMAYRFRADGQVEWWNYVAAEFGGGPYSIRRTSPVAPEQDVIIWRDYRLYFGVERKAAGGLNSRFEVGYVFGRRIEFIHGGDPDFEPDGTLLLRAGVSY